MALRFANGLFEPIWNRDRIDHVQITVAESIGIEGRGNFYEKTGALRDMVPNHLFQLVAMTAMEPPVSFDAEDIRAKKAEMFKAVHPLTLGDVVRGQYDAGAIAGQPVPAYRDEENVAPDSNVETFVAVRVLIDNWRWAGVPFYLRTGKRLATRSTEIAIRFKRAPYALFRETPVEELDADWLILRVQPDESIRLRFNAKRPGPAMALESVAMEFKYKDWFKQAPAVGYETLIYDCLIGDATLFQRADQVEAAWARGRAGAAAAGKASRRAISPIMRRAAKGPSPPMIFWPATAVPGGRSNERPIEIAGRVEILDDAEALAARAADLIADTHAGLRRAVPAVPVGRLDAARRLSSCWRSATTCPGIAPKFSSAMSALCRPIIPTAITAWRARRLLAGGNVQPRALVRHAHRRHAGKLRRRL